MFRVLSLDGGGIRGAFTAAVLAEIEEQIGSRIGNHFDLVAGTSTGAIIAAGVAAGFPARQIVDFYERHGTAVFTPRPPAKPKNWVWKLGLRIAQPLSRVAFRFPFDHVLQTKYDSRHLEDALTEVFSDRLFGDLRECRLVIPAVDVSAGRPVVFKTPHLPDMTRDRRYGIVDVLLATTAAPTFFPHATLNGHGALVDGGLWANNPGLVAYTEAMKIRECCTRECDPLFDATDVRVLSVGTGVPRYSLSPPDAQAGLGWWGPKVFETSSVSQSQGVDFQMTHLLGDRYYRINFTLPDPAWTLDATENLSTLIHFGQLSAHEELAQLHSGFFATTTPAFEPFELRIDAAAGARPRIDSCGQARQKNGAVRVQPDR